MKAKTITTLIAIVSVLFILTSMAQAQIIRLENLPVAQFRTYELERNTYYPYQEPELPDLVITDVFTDLNTGFWTPYNVVVENYGGPHAGQVMVQARIVYLYNETPTVENVVRRYIDAPNGEEAFSVTFNIDEHRTSHLGEPAQSYFITFKVDANNSVEESDEGNNAWACTEFQPCE